MYILSSQLRVPTMRATTTFLCQERHSAESRTIAYLSMVDDDTKNVTCPIVALHTHEDALSRGVAIPLGSTEFVAEALRVCGAPQPEPLSYPTSLRPWLKREIALSTAREALALSGPVFIKPTATKLFTGFIYRGPGDVHSNPDDLEQLIGLRRLPPDTPVWTAPPIDIASEVRFYFLNGQLYGAGRYDQSDDESATLPSGAEAQVMGQALSEELGMPFNGSIDLGYSPELGTFLVEANDGYALGLYQGVERRPYAEMLRARWRQLVDVSDCA